MDIANYQNSKMGKSSSSCISSFDSSSDPPFSSPNDKNIDDSIKDLSTDLKLGLSTPPPNYVSNTPKHREQRLDWPPIKPHLRSTLADKAADSKHRVSLYVKVYMEGIPIGRKLDLLAHKGYSGLITTLSHLFKTSIQCPDAADFHPGKHHVLTYEDKEGDWMMVGDVPWELFLTTVKRLKITRAS